jgi:superfamily II DNA or RNA helicase
MSLLEVQAVADRSTDMGGVLGEGFDGERPDILFLTLLISWQGTFAQYVGRLHRTHFSKKKAEE